VLTENNVHLSTDSIDLLALNTFL